MLESYQIVVVGGGPAGVTAALRAAELGAQVCLIERGETGGTAANDGVVPTRTLAYAARLLRQSRQFQEYGLLGALPQISFAEVLNHAQRTVYRLHESKQLFERLRAAGAVVKTGSGEAHFVDPQQLELADGTRIQAERFILCAGGHSRRIPFPGSELCLTIGDLWALKRLPDSLTIIGGAATGSQVASILNDFGVQVTLVERGPLLLGREDPQVARTLQEIFERRGIQVVCGIQGLNQVVRHPAGGLVVEVQLPDGPRSWQTQAVLSAIGWEANSDNLGLSAAGVRTERGYIQVNDFQQTSLPHIYAAGDITGRMMLVQSAGYEGRTAAENAVMGNVSAFRHEIVPHGGFTDPEYGGVGILEHELSNPEAAVVVMVPYQDLDRAVIEGHTDGFFKLIVSVENHRILGAAAVGEQALETIQLVAAAMTAGMWVEQLAELELAYPTYTAIAGLAARRAMAALGVMPLNPAQRAAGRQSAAEWERSGS
jgi:pyruvate/2-oxoglutarate dehydrogenase complex dihydrolipoamide dehydrogenase (E3) component